MRSFQDARRTTLLVQTGVATLISLLMVLVSVPVTAAIRASSTGVPTTSDALYQPVPFGTHQVLTPQMWLTTSRLSAWRPPPTVVAIGS